MRMLTMVALLLASLAAAGGVGGALLSTLQGRAGAGLHVLSGVWGVGLGVLAALLGLIAGRSSRPARAAVAIGAGGAALTGLILWLAPPSGPF